MRPLPETLGLMLHVVTIINLTPTSVPKITVFSILARQVSCHVTIKKM